MTIESGHLVTNTEQGILSTLIPLVFNPETQTFLGHISRNNLQGKLASKQEALLISVINEAYISPSWYASKVEHGKVVPTWDYMMVHAYGEIIIHNEPAWLLDQVIKLTNRFEASMPNPWELNHAPADYISRQLNAITGVELKLSRIETSFKLSQNKTIADIDGVTNGLAALNKHEVASIINKFRPEDKRCPANRDALLRENHTIVACRRTAIWCNVLTASVLLVHSLYK